MKAMNNNWSEFKAGEKIFRVTAKEMTETPVSELLCSNFIELGFGYQVEGMWSEMLFNRSFEKILQLAPATYNWFGHLLSGDWREQDWYHTGYEHNRWYACPAQERPPSMSPDSSFIVEKAPYYSLQITQEPGGIHGSHCLTIDNFEPERWCGVAQNGKYLRKGQDYKFRGYFERLSPSGEAELRFYAGQDEIDWAEPAMSVPIGELSAEGGIIEKTFRYEGEDGWFAFSVFISPGTKVKLDAFSLMPVDTMKGWRNDVVEGLKRVNPKLLRFPGGCFASFHDWRDAVGPFDNRKPEPSYFWGDINYNDVGTDELCQLCEELGAEVMMVVNVFHPDKKYLMTNDVNQERIHRDAHGFELSHITDLDEGIRRAAQWVEYCNGPAESEFGAMRAANGHPKPYGVQFWEMDNETFRWFSPKEYAEILIRYSKAMKAVDPTIKIGMCSYHFYKEHVAEMLEICGEYVDFLADRVCEPDNLAYKVGVVREYNRTHDHKIVYADTEALQNRDPNPAPFVADYYGRHGITYQSARRTWIYALNLVSNLMMDQRYGGDVLFMCFNNLANTSGQSCIETPKESVILPACGLVYERMSRSLAAWPLKIEGYEPSARKDVQIQAAWDKDRQKLVLYLLNRTDNDTAVSLDLTALVKGKSKLSKHILTAAEGYTEETVKSTGNIRQAHFYDMFCGDNPVSFAMPRFSFTEIIIG
jgi:hypothetical protein